VNVLRDLPSPITLIVPAPFSTISGGYGYDRRIVGELRAASRIVDVVELDGSFPLVDAEARTSAVDAWFALPSQTRPVIDGLALPAFADLGDALATRATVGLIHHPLCLETGLDDADRARLAELEHGLFPRLRRVVVTSATTADTLASRFAIPMERIRTVVPGTDDAARCREAYGGTCHILSVGTLIPRKGHDILLRALAASRDLDWHLIIVGANRDLFCADFLRSLARELKIADRVDFAGERIGDALESLWRDADVFALATRYEGYGMAIAEALKRGLPVVVTDGGAAGVLVTPDAGYVCAVDDVDQIARALRRLVADHDRRRRMAERAWQIGQSLPSWRAQAALFAAALN
jgi:glycosyltransferase involved in cell wall biosynthesis